MFNGYAEQVAGCIPEWISENIFKMKDDKFFWPMAKRKQRQ